MFSELGITLADGTVWLSIGQGLLFGAVCLLFGVWIARFVGLLDAGAPAGETLGVGLTSGLLVLASWWAAIASGGRSSFTPVAVGFAVAIGLAAVRRWRPADRPEAQTSDDEPATDAAPSDAAPATPASTRRRNLRRGRRRRRGLRRRGRARLRLHPHPEPARRGPADRGHGHRLLRDPRARPRPDRHGDDLLARRLRADRRPAGPDLVSLGRGLAGGSRDLDLRGRAAGRPAFHRPAADPPRGGRDDRHARPAADRRDVARARSSSVSSPACSWPRSRSSPGRTSARGPSA